VRSWLYLPATFSPCPSGADAAGLAVVSLPNSLCFRPVGLVFPYPFGGLAACGWCRSFRMKTPAACCYRLPGASVPYKVWRPPATSTDGICGLLTGGQPSNSDFSGVPPARVPLSHGRAGPVIFHLMPTCCSPAISLRDRLVPVADQAEGKPAGALWMASGTVPGTLGLSFGVGCPYTPSTVHLLPSPAGRAWGRRWGRVRRAQPVFPEGRIWLILPVVICLSQRLSHACLSISTLYCETANGSLNQLSFI
jgi:hypothetical protein